MTKRTACALVLVACLSACSSEPAPPAVPPNAPIEPLVVPGHYFHVTGTVQAPKGFDATTSIFVHAPRPFAEIPLGGVQVFLADAKLQPIQGVSPVNTDSSGNYAIDSPDRAGFVVMSKPASASATLMAYYHDGDAAPVDVASTMVGWKLMGDMASHSVAIQSLDPGKVDHVTQLIHTALTDGTELNPDYSLASWPAALDFYTYRMQGAVARAFNDLIPGSVAAKMSR